MKKIIIVILLIVLAFPINYVGKRAYKYHQFNSFVQNLKDHLSLGENIYRFYGNYFKKTKNASFDKNAFIDSSLNYMLENDYIFYDSGAREKEFLDNDNVGFFDVGDSLISYYIIDKRYEMGYIDTPISFFKFLFLKENIHIDTYLKPNKWELMDEETRRRVRFRENYKKLNGCYPEEDTLLLKSDEKRKQLEERRKQFDSEE